ncbi:MAG: DUF393 domain-containing protein [Dinoroseobacter sp.]|nr:DUF393 domain-containing protein [Dinoroseobacter sp.]
MTQTDHVQTETSVLFNGACPVCSAEIKHYETYARKQALPLRFEDLGTTDLNIWGVTQDEAARRLHVRQGATILSGLPAFQALWKEMPRYRWLAKTTGLPVIRQVAAATYDYVLAPLLYRWHRSRFAGAEKTGKNRQSS